MNEIIKINDLITPNMSESYFPIEPKDGEEIIAPEFWIEVPTIKQGRLITLFKQYGVDYKIIEKTGIDPNASMAVCRVGETFNESFPVVRKICKRIGIDRIIVSDGGISTIDSDGELINFINFD